jgi:hypothetical protein
VVDQDNLAALKDDFAGYTCAIGRVPDRITDNILI